MSDWFKRITAIISSTPEEKLTAINNPSQLLITSRNSQVVSSFPKPRKDLTFSERQSQTIKNKDFSAKSLENLKKHSHPLVLNSKEGETNMAEEGNLKALKRLRELPRGTQVDTRIAAIDNLLGEKEVFKTLKMLRWPQGVVCPRCHSSNIVRREPPANAIDQRHYYVCLNCKGEGSPSDFDDFTGLPVGSLHAMRQWILCWYLIGFCSVNQIAKVLGISPQEVIQLASIGSELTQLPDPALEETTKRQLASKEKKSQEIKRKEIDRQEEETRSESKGRYKPGPKSKL